MVGVVKGVGSGVEGVVKGVLGADGGGGVLGLMERGRQQWGVIKGGESGGR